MAEIFTYIVLTIIFVVQTMPPGVFLTGESKLEIKTLTPVTFVAYKGEN